MANCFLAAGAGVAVVLLMSATPLFKNDVLIKIPVVREPLPVLPCRTTDADSYQLGSYYEDKTPASDKPF